MAMNMEKEIARIRFMLGEHARVLDLASSSMGILESATAMGYHGEQTDDAAWKFSRPKIKAAVDALNHVIATDHRAAAYQKWCDSRGVGMVHPA